jgi:hypothetical protein
MDQNEELRKFLYDKAQQAHFTFVPFAGLPYINGLFVPIRECVVMQTEDFYPVQKQFGIKHYAMLKLADAAGVHWSSDGANVGRMDNRSNPNYCSFRVVGKIRSAEGLFTEISASKHLDLDAKRSAAETKHADGHDFKTKKGWKVWPKNKDEYVKKMTERDVGQLRDNMDERCESGAQVRVIKSMMHLPGSLPALKDNPNMPAWVNREFHIVRYILDPQNPNVQQAQLSCFQQAMGGIYGTAPAITHTPQTALPISQAPIDVTPKAENITKSTENFTRNAGPDSSLIDFENQDTNDKIHTITQLIKKTGYTQYDNDISTCPLEDWTDKQLIDYFVHIKGAAKR